MRLLSRTYRTFATGCAAALLASFMAVALPARAQDQAGASAGAAPAGAAPAGAAPAQGQNAYDWQKWQAFWSFKPVVKADPPAVNASGWVRNPIDAFVLARLEQKNIAPAPEADRPTLIRRLSFDLTGLPPTPEEIRAFLKDESPDAYEKLVDRLLASPHYGERWGRHWLDLARYSPGRITFPGVKGSRGVSEYLSYVVRAFNADKPYDRFLTEQLAGDLLPPAADRQQYFDAIAAPAFLSLGAWFDMETDPNRLRLEMVDEMVNATTKTFLGLSVACARCHDHKFDPVPAADYYALGGVFRSTRLVGEFSEFWRDGRVRQLRPLAMPDEVAANDQVRRQIAAKKAGKWSLLSGQHAALTAAWKADEARYRAAAGEAGPLPFLKVFEAEDFDGQDNLRISQLMRDGVAAEVIETQTPTAQWVRYKAEVPETARYTLEALYSTDDETPVSVQANGKTVVENALNTPTGGWDLKYQRWQILGAFELRSGLNFLRVIVKEGNFPRVDRLRLYRSDDALDSKVRQLAESHKLHPLLLANFLKDPHNPWPNVAGVAPYLDAGRQKAAAALDGEIATLALAIKPHEQIVAVTDAPTPTDLPVHLRGEVYQTSEQAVPRGVPRLFDHLVDRPAVPPAGSGRLELARWLTDPRHPLTARVMANRIWHWHFGRGIVATTSDFGSTGEEPTHPELLDWLAATFAQDYGWSVKKLHRLILTSSTYRMSSCPDAGAARLDPENKLLAHFPRRRLEAEAIYDAMRSTTNMIPRQEPGQPLDPDKSKDRALYILTNGRSPKGLGPEVRKFFALFDYDLSPVHLPERPTSATPAQSLFWLNNPLPKYLADRFAERLLKMDKLDDPKRLEMAYLLALGRPPGTEMAAQTLAYLRHCEHGGMTRQEAWSQVCLALYGAAEFRYVE